MGLALGSVRAHGKELLQGAGFALGTGLSIQAIAAMTVTGDENVSEPEARGQAYTSLSAISVVAGATALGAAGLCALVGRSGPATAALGASIGLVSSAGVVAAMRGSVDIGYGERPQLPAVRVTED